MSSTEEFEVLELIGRGSFGCVRKVKRKSDGKLLVRKEIPYGHMNQKERSQLVSEFRILSELNHPNIVQYVRHDHIAEHHMLFLYMEYCDGGDLSSIIKRYKSSNEYLPEGIIWNIFTQILMALYRCHYGVNSPLISNIYQDLEYPQPSDSTRVIIHRDIKPDNIFLGNGNFKLGDFGLAKSLNHEIEFATTCVGTPYYMSPEVLLDKPYSPLCDIWSLGCVIYELCALHPPFQAKTHLHLQEKIQFGECPPIPSHYSSSLKRIIDSCIKVSLDARSSTYDLLQDLNFKIQMKDLQLTNYEVNLKKFEAELLLKEQELSKSKQLINEEMNYQRTIIEQELEDIRINYQNEFEYVVDKEVNRRLKQLSSTSSTPRPQTKSTPQQPSNSSPVISNAAQYHGTPSDYSMGMTPSPSMKQHLKGPRDREYETPMKLPTQRRPLQLIDNDPPVSKKYTSKPITSNNGFAVPKTNPLLTKNAKLFEKARMNNKFDEDVGLPSPFMRKFNNDW